MTLILSGLSKRPFAIPPTTSLIIYIHIQCLLLYVSIPYHSTLLESHYINRARHQEKEQHNRLAVVLLLQLLNRKPETQTKMQAGETNPENRQALIQSITELFSNEDVPVDVLSSVVSELKVAKTALNGDENRKELRRADSEDASINSTDLIEGEGTKADDLDGSSLLDLMEYEDPDANDDTVTDELKQKHKDWKDSKQKSKAHSAGSEELSVGTHETEDSAADEDEDPTERTKSTAMRKASSSSRKDSHGSPRRSGERSRAARRSSADVSSKSRDKECGVSRDRRYRNSSLPPQRGVKWTASVKDIYKDYDREDEFRKRREDTLAARSPSPPKNRSPSPERDDYDVDDEDKSVDSRSSRGRCNKSRPKRGEEHRGSRRHSQERSGSSSSGSRKSSVERGSRKSCSEGGSRKSSVERGSRRSSVERGSRKSSVERGSRRSSVERGSRKSSVERGSSRSSKRHGDTSERSEDSESLDDHLRKGDRGDDHDDIDDAASAKSSSSRKSRSSRSKDHRSSLKKKSSNHERSDEEEGSSRSSRRSTSALKERSSKSGEISKRSSSERGSSRRSSTNGKKSDSSRKDGSSGDGFDEWNGIENTNNVFRSVDGDSSSAFVSKVLKDRSSGSFHEASHEDDDEDDPFAQEAEYFSDDCDDFFVNDDDDRASSPVPSVTASNSTGHSSSADSSDFGKPKLSMNAHFSPGKRSRKNVVG